MSEKDDMAQALRIARNYVMATTDSAARRGHLARIDAALAAHESRAQPAIIYTMINHEHEPHCCGCWNIDYNALIATCNECGARRDIAEFLSAQPASIPDAYEYHPGDSIKKIAEEMVAVWTATRQGDAEITLEIVDEWAHRIMCFAAHTQPAQPASVADVAKVVELLEEVLWGHTHTDSVNYNECEKDECLWCEQAKEQIALLKVAAPQPPAKENG